MKYFKVFNTENEYLEYIHSEGCITPYVITLRDSSNTWISADIHDYSKDYFTIESLEDNNEIKFGRSTGGGDIKELHIAASTDNGVTWTEYVLPYGDEQYEIATINSGEKIMFKYISGAFKRNARTNTYFATSGRFNAYGNVMSLVKANNFSAETLSYGVPFLFKNSKIVSAKNLIFPKNASLDEYSNYGMFSGCTYLIEAPELPATTLANGCYFAMFSNCSSLTTAPELLATTLANQCYRAMFYGCSSLTEAPELPATTLANTCYCEMFKGCTNLTTAPELSATTMAASAYTFMFSGCTALTTVQEELPARTLEDSCYRGMFDTCTSLTTAPELPATTLANTCYRAMFSNCSSLTSAPSELPATTMAASAYTFMFKGCTNLTTAPELPATTLVGSCYTQMFSGCAKLNYIKCLATDISADNCVYGWTSGVASSGTFVKASTMEGWSEGASGIPTNWIVRNDTYVEVTGVTISASAATVNKGSTYTLTANVLPSNADDKVVSWSTSDSNVATVSNGVVTGVGCGDATITVTTHDKGYTATCNMSVENHVASVDLNTYIVTIISGNTYQLEATVLPIDACDKSVTWTSNNTNVATVDSNGLVSGITTGSATVTVTTVDGGLTKNCSVTVNEGQHATGVTLSDAAITVNKDETYALTATVMPNDAIDKSVTWTTSDATIATVDSNGVVSGVASGSATITVTTVDGGYTAQCSVSVTNIHDYSKDYFTIESLANNNTIKIGKAKSPSNISLSYSTDNGATWTDLTISDGIDFAIINTGDKIMFKGTNDRISTAWDTYYRFYSTGNFKVYGNAMSLLWGDDFESHSEFKTGTTHNLCGLFYGTTTLVDASDLILPATTCMTSSYNGTFRGCTNLATAPELPATQSAQDCYSSMFEGCINLEEAPEINLVNLSQACCKNMFAMNRNNRITTPKMTKSPILRVATSATNCYQGMFQGNGNLVEVTCLLTSKFQCSDWLKNCSSTGTFKKASSASWSSGTSGIPNGWVVEDYTE